MGDLAVEGEVYKMLHTVMEQTTENNFQNSLDGLLGRLASGLKTKDFYKYFQKEWVPNKTKWGYCYRVALKINTNMFVEAFHQVFKRLYLGGKYNKCMDTCLVNLIRFIRDKGFDRLIKLTKGKQTYCISNITERHHRSPGMPLQSVQPKKGKWGVLSEGGKDI